MLVPATLFLNSYLPDAGVVAAWVKTVPPGEQLVSVSIDSDVQTASLDFGEYEISDHERGQVVAALATGGSALVVSVTTNAHEAAGKAPRPEKWAANNEPVTTTWEVLWSKAEAGTFWMALWQLNSDSFDFRVVVDSAVLFEADLSELHSDFKLNSVSGKAPAWELAEYSPRRWQYRPPAPIRFDLELRLEFQAQGGTKKVVRGISSWSPA